MARTPFATNPGLVAIAVDYTRVNGLARGYIADIVAPRVRVPTMEFRYPEVKVDDIFNVYDNQVDRLGRLNEIYSKTGEALGAVLDYGLAEPIPYRDEMAATANDVPWSLKENAIYNVVDKNQLAREIRVAALMQSPSSYGAQTEDETATPWSASDFDIVGTVQAKSDSMLLPPNAALMSLPVLRILQRSPSIAEGLGGQFTKGKVMKREEVAEALGVDRIIVGNTLKRQSKRGQNLVTGPIWGNHLSLLHLPATGADGVVNNVNVPAFALTFQWNGEVSGEIPDPDMGLYGGIRVRSGHSLVEKVVAPLGGYLFQNIA